MEILGVAGVVLLVLLYLILIAYAVVTYVIISKSLYTIAARRGITNPGIAWVPVANSWIIGSLSDQYHQRKYGHDPNIRQPLLIWSIISQAALLTVNLFNAIANTYDGLTNITPLLFVLMLALASLGLAIVQTVLQLKAYYSLYASCKPQLAVLFLVLSIVTPAGPFLVYANRNSDDGLPPKKQEE